MRFFIYILYLTSFFPYLGYWPFAGDIRPYYFISAIIVILLHCIYSQKLLFSKNIIIHLWLTFGAFVMFLYSEYNLFMSVKQFYNYLSLFIVMWAFNISFSYFIPSKKMIKTVLIIWMIFGIISQFIDINFIAQNRGNFIWGRGSSSLGPEPNIYAFMILFIYIFYYINYGLDHGVFLLSSFQILLLSRSPQVIIILLAMIFFVHLLSKPKTNFIPIVLGVFFCTLIVYFVSWFFVFDYESSRFMKIFNNVDSLNSIFYYDDSTFIRYVFMTFPLRYLFEGNLFPNGFSDFGNAYDYIMANQYINYNYSDDYSRFYRIGGYYSAVVFNFGLLGFLYVLWNLKIFFRTFLKINSSPIAMTFILFISFSSIIPMALPLVPMILISIYKIYEQ